MSKSKITEFMRCSRNVGRVDRPFGGYFRQAEVELDEKVIRVGPGTEGGEYLRRTWQPVCLSSELGELPMRVTMLGEKLVLFRTTSGGIGLLDLHCSHRGASLEYGLPSDVGIQCCYHGWHFACDGQILDTPNDPASSLKNRMCHPAYPVHEFKGIIFAWMGPPDEVPEFTLLDSYGMDQTDMVPFSLNYPCNWVQLLDNTQDPTHSCFLHTRVSGAQFSESWGALPELDYVETPIGMINVNVRRWKDNLWVRTTDVILPNLNQTGALWLSAEDEETFLGPALTRWMRPIDDDHTQMIGWRYFNEELDREKNGDVSQVGLGKIDFIGQTEDERSYPERQRIPGDFEAIAGQGDIAESARWNLNHGDRGVVMMRRLITENIDAVKAGESFKTIETAGQVDGQVSTYTRDTVMNIPARTDDESSLMKTFGQSISSLVFDAATYPPDKAKQAFSKGLNTFLKDHQ
jgi:nitrite reductase/ring-hydroxylating ferredoxin subunit